MHAEAKGLRPGRHYWYRFRAGNALSPIGRTRTAPAAGSTPSQFRFAFASCQQYEQGYFAAYRDMANRDLDLVMHLGDYIYEKSWGSRLVRQHEVGIPTTLSEFRDRYALYKLDPDLQAAHAAFPWLAIWDDHEVADDYANDRSYTTRDPAQFMKMRAAAYQAYYEHLPLPASARPRGPFATIYERYRFGDMLDVMLLDDRQYRSPPACVGDARPGTVADCPERTLEARTMLGSQQEQWLDRQIASAEGALDHRGPADADGRARCARRKAGIGSGWTAGTAIPTPAAACSNSIATHKPRNPVVIGGDRHAFFVADLKRDFGQAARARPRQRIRRHLDHLARPERRQHRSRRSRPIRSSSTRRGDKRGYATAELTAARCTIGFEALDDEKQKDSAVAPPGDLRRRRRRDGRQAGVTWCGMSQATHRRRHRAARPPGRPRLAGRVHARADRGLRSRPPDGRARPGGAAARR